MFKALFGLDKSQEIDEFDLVFRGGWVLALVLIAAAIAFAIYLYRAERSLPPKRRLIMTVCQAAALLTLIVVILEPTAEVKTTREYQPTMIVMLDTSRSMAITDQRNSAGEISEAAKALGKLPVDANLRGDQAGVLQQTLGSPSRIELALGALDHPEIQLLERLEENYEVRFFTFDGTLRPEPGGDEENARATRTANGETSKIGSAIEEAVGRFAGQPVAGALVLSDFAWVEGVDPAVVARQLKTRDLPVYTIPIGLPSPPDLHLRSVIAPKVVFKGDRVPLRVKLESRGFDGRTVDLAMKINGVEASRQEVELTGGVQFPEMMFIPQQSSGTLDLEFEVAALGGETSDANNRTAHKIRILDEKIKVLYIEGMPRWEYRYLRWVLLRDPRLDVQFLMTQGDPALAGSSARHIGRFPQDPQEALKYDLIILGDVPASYFNTAQLDLMHTLVKERGGSLLMVAGPVAAPGTYRDTPIEEILPVNLGSGGFESVGTNVSPVVTAEGQRSLSTSLSLSPETSARIWSHVRPMYSLPQLGGAKPGATVLLSLPKASEQIPDYPLVAWQRFGTGKSLFVATEDLWRMRLEVGDKYHARFWGQTIQFLTLSRLLGQNKQITLETEEDTYSAGEQIRIFANVLTESFDPVIQPSYDVVIGEKDTADTAVTLELSPVPGKPGLYTGSHLAGRDGSYVLQSRPQDESISNRIQFEVATEPLEDRETAMDAEVARQLAEISGGRQLDMAGLAGFTETLGEPETLTNTVRIQRDLWDVPLWFLLVVGFAGVEWYFRRKDNLV